MSPKSILRLVRTLESSPTSLTQTYWSLLFNIPLGIPISTPQNQLNNRTSKMTSKMTDNKKTMYKLIYHSYNRVLQHILLHKKNCQVCYTLKKIVKGEFLFFCQN